MRRRVHCVALAAVLGASLTALAAAPWAQEPAGLFGILLGKPFPAAGVIADCPLFEPFRRENLPDELCVDTRAGFSADSIPLKHAPLGGVPADASVELHDGLVRAIRVHFDARRYAEASALLRERYGPPHARTAGEEGETLAWNGAHVTMTLREPGDGKGRARLDLRPTAAVDDR